MEKEIYTSAVLANGMVVIPEQVRKVLKVNIGDELTFVYKDGCIVLSKSIRSALRAIQDDLKNEAQRKGLYSEEDVQEYLNEK